MSATVIDLPTKGLPPGKTTAEALQRAIVYKRQLWSSYEWLFVPEEERIEALLQFCTALYRGDVLAGKLLASAALYE